MDQYFQDLAGTYGYPYLEKESFGKG